MADRINKSNLDDIAGRSVFVDANVWVYLFCEIGYAKKVVVAKYSSIFKHLLKNRVPIKTDVMVLSEFINRYTRIAYSKYLITFKVDAKNCTYKDYRSTEDFKKVWSAICGVVKQRILSKAEPVNAAYDNTLLADLLDDSILNRDFNDGHIVKLCMDHDMLLLTHDRDFSDADIGIVSENNVYR